MRVFGDPAFASGHGSVAALGRWRKPLGKVGADLTEQRGYAAARLTGLAILAGLTDPLGDLDRIEARAVALAEGMSLFDISAARWKLHDLLGVQVDAVSPRSLPYGFREEVLVVAEPVALCGRGFPADETQRRRGLRAAPPSENARRDHA